MPRGRIKTFLEDRRFGFISPDRGGPDIFFHKDEVNDRGYDLEPGAPVEYEEARGRKPGEKKAVSVRILDFAPETPPDAKAAAPASRGAPSLPPECRFDSFYDDENHLHMRLFFEAPQAAADVFRRTGLKSTQFRQIYQGFLSFAGPLRDNRISFDDARERFGVFYVERVVRQVERKVLPPVVKELVDAHRETALKETRQMLALFRYITNIYCYFGESDKN